MAELRVVGRFLRYRFPVNGRVFFRNDLPYGFVLRYWTAYGLGGYAPYRVDTSLTQRLHGVFHGCPHRRMDFRSPNDLRVAPDRCGDLAGYRGPGATLLIHVPDLHPSLGLDFRFRLGFRFAGKGDQPFYGRLAFVLFEGFSCRVQFLVTGRRFYRP